MKRKVVQQGPSTLMITLGAEYTRKQNITKGIELDVLEVGNSLLVRPPRQEKEQVEIHADGNIINLKSQLMTFYFYGIDVISIRFDPQHRKEILEAVEHTVAKHLLGMVVKRKEPDFCVVESFSESGPMKLDEAINTSLRKIIRNAELCVKAFRTKQELVEEITENHDYVKQFSFCAHRLLNKGGHIDITLLTAYTRAIDKIVEISNHLRHIAKHHSSQKHSKISIEGMEQLQELLNLMYQAFYHAAKYNDFFNHHSKIGEYYYIKSLDTELRENFGMVRDLAMNLVRQAIFINYKKG